MAKRTIRFVLPYPPVTGNHAVRHAGGRHYKSRAAQAYDSLVLTALDRVGLVGRGLPGPLHVEFFVAPPDRRARDDDNLLKVVKDALTKARFWKDDSNKVIRSTALHWDDPAPSGQVEIHCSYEG